MKVELRGLDFLKVDGKFSSKKWRKGKEKRNGVKRNCPLPPGNSNSAICSIGGLGLGGMSGMQWRATIICRLIRHTKCVGQQRAKIAEINFHRQPREWAKKLHCASRWQNGMKKGRANEAFGEWRRIPSGKKRREIGEGKENLIWRKIKWWERAKLGGFGLALIIIIFHLPTKTINLLHTTPLHPHPLAHIFALPVARWFHFFS